MRYKIYTNDGKEFEAYVNIKTPYCDSVITEPIFVEGMMYFGNLIINPNKFAYAIPVNENE
ncbi:MAG: hypothetical protein ACRDDM_03075 [Paraclostridium sp.]